MVESANQLRLMWGIQFQNETKREIYSKKRFGEVDGDRRLDITEERFYVSVFLPLVDTALYQLEDRFKGLKIVSNHFNFLLPKNIIQFDEVDLVKSCYDYIQFYKSDVTSDLITRQVL